MFSSPYLVLGSARLMFARQPFEEFAHLLLLRGLRLHPVSDELLLLAHMRDEALDAFGEIGERGGALALVQRIEGGGFFGQHFGAWRVRRLGVARQEVFKFGVEAILRLARLQIEEAENERTGKAEQ